VAKSARRDFVKDEGPDRSIYMSTPNYGEGLMVQFFQVARGPTIMVVALHESHDHGDHGHRDYGTMRQLEVKPVGRFKASNKPVYYQRTICSSPHSEIFDLDDGNSYFISWTKGHNQMSLEVTPLGPTMSKEAK